MASQKQVEKKLEPWLELNNKAVMATGASSGLGWEFCLDLAKAGCRIIAAARRIDWLKSLCDEINGSKPSLDQLRAVALELHIGAKEPIMEDGVKKAWGVFGKIDVLINNAGVRGGVRSLLDVSEEEWDNVIRINQTGTWLVSKHVCMLMRDAKQGGSIINISSTAAVDRVQLHGSHAYSASKTAVHAITKVMAMELGQHNIRVNAIAPALFESEITNGLMQKTWVKKVVPRIIPLGTFGSTNPAMTSVVRYLIHESSQYVTGNVFIVDSGGTLPGIPLFSSL